MNFIIMAFLSVAFMAWLFISVGICMSSVDVMRDSLISGIIILLLGAISLIGCLATLFYIVDSQDDDSEHCGPGTEYRESSHYNPSTRTTHTDWWCEVK